MSPFHTQKQIPDLIYMETSNIKRSNKLFDPHLQSPPDISCLPVG